MTPADLGHWSYSDEITPSSHVGFLYRITDTNHSTVMYYYGIKTFHNKIRRRPLKGKKRIRRDTTESNWLNYTGSSRALNEAIDLWGIDSFIFEIISLHNSKWDLNYAELKAIVDNDALRDNRYYNEYVGRIGRCPESSKY